MNALTQLYIKGVKSQSEGRDSAFAGRWVLEAASMATKSKGVPLSSHREILEISKTF